MIFSLGCAVAILHAGCPRTGTTVPTASRSFVLIGTFDPRTAQAPRIKDELCRSSIDYYFEGSRLYGIYVPKRDARRAKQVIEALDLGYEVNLLKQSKEIPE